MSLTSATVGRKGRVLQAKPPGSFATLEASARLVDAKGVFFNRGAHRHEAAINQWLRSKEESEFVNGEIVTEQLLEISHLKL